MVLLFAVNFTKDFQGAKIQKATDSSTSGI